MYTDKFGRSNEYIYLFIYVLKMVSLLDRFAYSNMIISLKYMYVLYICMYWSHSQVQHILTFDEASSTSMLGPALSNAAAPNQPLYIYMYIYKHLKK